jgi:hypothetical protein
MPLNESRFINKANPSLAEAHQSTSRPSKQEVLAAAGMVPGATGMGADLISAALYAKEGDWKNTLWSLASFIPIVGMAAGAKRIRSFQKLKSLRADGGILSKLDSHQMSKEGAAELKKIRTELDTFLDVQRPGKVTKATNSGIKNASDSKNINKLDDKKYDLLYERAVNLAEREGAGLKIADVGAKVAETVNKSEEAKQKVLDRLFKEGQSGFTEGGRRIR